MLMHGFERERWAAKRSSSGAVASWYQPMATPKPWWDGQDTNKENAKPGASQPAVNGIPGQQDVVKKAKQE